MKRYYLDLFSGIGGFALGAEWAGLEFDGHYFSEVDEYASSVYKKRFPEAIELGDIKRIDCSKLREEIMGGLSKVKAERYGDMYSLYNTGKSLADVAETYGVSRQAVYDVFATRGWTLRTKAERPYQIIDDKKFSLGSHGYYALTTDKGVLAHRYVWEKENGVIPNGYDIHHIDGDKSNNAIFNLRLLEKTEHTKLHQAQKKEVKMEAAPIFVSGGFPDHASPTVSPESAERPQTGAIFGLNAGECFASFDPKSRSLKMSLGSLFPMEAGFSQEFCGTLPKAGMIRNGRLYPLMKPERPTSAKGSGLWPSPRANSGNGPCRHGEGGLNLQTAVKPWPTLKASEAAHGSPNQRGSGGDLGITAAVIHAAKEKAALWPTPRTAGMCGGTGNWNRLKNNCADIEEARKMGAGNCGQLNAVWCGRLMGYPDKWTDVDTEEVETAQAYPDAWRDGTWDTIPRIVSGQKHRRARLKCLGNAIVPQIAAYLWRLIAEALWE